MDEAAWVADETWAAARPLVAAAHGRLVVQSTPGAAAGFFHELATKTPDGWAAMTVRSDEVATISPEFLAKEKREMTAELYRQEYLAEFAGRISAGLFNADQIRALILEEPKA